MTKVCHVTSAHNPEDIRIFHKECVSLAKAGYEVYLVECGASYDKNGVHIVGFGERTGGRLKRFTKYAKLAYKKAAELDCELYHFHDPELLPYALKLKRRGKKVIFDSHERYVKQILIKPYLKPGIAKITAGLYGAYEKSVLSKLDLIIFPCTEKGGNPFEGYGTETVFIDNYPMLDELEAPDGDCEKEKNTLCYIGSLTYERGVTDIVKALILTDCRLYLAGTFQTEEYRKETEALPGYEKVTYLGQIGRKEVRDVLSKSKLGISTILNVGQYNYYDNLPTKAFEYMAMGLPVVLTSAEYTEKVMAETGAGICVDPTDHEGFAKAVTELLGDEARLSAMRENALRAARERFNWDSQAAKLVAAYGKILNSEK